MLALLVTLVLAVTPTSAPLWATPRHHHHVASGGGFNVCHDFGTYRVCA